MKNTGHMYSIFSAQSGLSKKSLANVKTSVRHLARALEKKFEDLEWPDLQDRALERLENYLRDLRSGAKGLNRYVSNNKSWLNRLIKFGRRKGYLRKVDLGLSPTWQTVLSVEGYTAKDRTYWKYQRARVFARFCTARHIEPVQVTPETFYNFRDWLRDESHYANWKEEYHRAMRTFSHHLPGIIPSFEIPQVTNERLPNYGLRHRDWPELLRNDWDKYAYWATGQSIDLHNPRRRNMRKKTLNKYRTSLEMLLGYLVNIYKRDISNIGLRKLLDHEKWVTDYVVWFKQERAGGIFTRGLEAYICSLHAIAKTYYQMEPLKRSDWWLWKLLQLVKDQAFVDPAKKANPPTPEELELIPMYFDERIIVSEKNFGNRPSRLAGHRRYVARNARNRLMYRIMIVRPLRLENMLGMKLNWNLIKRENEAWGLYYRPEELKVEKTKKGPNIIDWDFPEELVPELEEYLEKHRARLIEQKPDCDLIFPSSESKMQGESNVADKCGKVAMKVLGRAVTPHRFRDSFATHMLMRTGNMAIVQHMLGHSSIKTTEEHYARLNPRKVCQEFDKMRHADVEAIRKEQERKIRRLMDEGLTREAAELLLKDLDDNDDKKVTGSVA
jgi:integrase